MAGDGPEPAWVLNMVSHNPDVKQPTQRYYHLPLEWLRDHNTLVIFEEVGGDGAGDDVGHEGLKEAARG